MQYALLIAPPIDLNLVKIMCRGIQNAIRINLILTKYVNYNILINLIIF